MKKICALLIAAILSCSLAGCGSSGISQEDYDKVVSERDALQQQLDSLQENQEETTSKEQEPEDSSSKEETPQGSRQVLIDQDGIKITYMGIEQGFGTEIKLQIENNSEKTIVVQQRDMSVNGIMIDGIFSCDVRPGKKANDSISILDTYLEENDIETIEDIELYFHIFDDDTFDTILESDMITIQMK